MGEPAQGPAPRGPDDRNEHLVACSLRAALPTNRHGEMLFDMVANLLGDAALVEAFGDGSQRRLFRREGALPNGVVPWQLVGVSRNPHRTFPMDFGGLEPVPPPPPRPGKAPRLRGLGEGTLDVHDGRHYLQVRYAEDGRWCETTRGGPAATLAGLLPVLAAEGASTVERISDFVAGFDVARHGPGRLVLPVPGVYGAEGAWQGGLNALRGALAAGRVPADAAWAVADGLGRGILAFGPSREEALSSWRAAMDRAGPAPPPPPAQARPEPPSFEPPEPWRGDRPPDFGFGMEIVGQAASGPPLPPPPPGSEPAAVVPLGRLPEGPPPLGEWRPFLDAFGNTVHAAFRADPRGWTVVGDRVLAVLAPPDIESGLDEANREHERLLQKMEWSWPPGSQALPYVQSWVRFLDENSGNRVRPVETSTGRRADAALAPLDGGLLRTCAVRLRRAKS